jgi:hypothetical protein
MHLRRQIKEVLKDGTIPNNKAMNQSFEILEVTR